MTMQTTTAAILLKAGSGANFLTIRGLTSAARISNAALQAENYLNAISRYNWSDAYSSLNADVKSIIEEACSNLAAIYLISFDMKKFTTRIEAEDMINVLWARFQQCVEILKDQKGVDFIKGA